MRLIIELGCRVNVWVIVRDLNSIWAKFRIKVHFRYTFWFRTRVGG